MTDVIDVNNNGEDSTDGSQDVQMTQMMQPIPVQRRTREPWVPELLDHVPVILGKVSCTFCSLSVQNAIFLLLNLEQCHAVPTKTIQTLWAWSALHDHRAQDKIT